MWILDYATTPVHHSCGTIPISYVGTNYYIHFFPLLIKQDTIIIATIIESIIE
jgi:hypothetical protein